jgi:uncharacterized RDD family membrane protein YckC
MEGWQSVEICDLVSDFVFHRRTAEFLHQSQSVSSTGTRTTFSESVTLDIDQDNKVSRPLDMSGWYWLVFIGLLAFLEHRYRATPGKKIMRLQVVNLAGDAPSMLQALARNALKFLPAVVFIVVPTLLTVLGLGTFLDPANYVTPDHRVTFPEWFWDFLWLPIALAVLAGIASFTIVMSVVSPWSKAGRGIYDRLAGTQVIR